MYGLFRFPLPFLIMCPNEDPRCAQRHRDGGRARARARKNQRLETKIWQPFLQTNLFSALDFLLAVTCLTTTKNSFFSAIFDFDFVKW